VGCCLQLLLVFSAWAMCVFNHEEHEEHEEKKDLKENI
jgi:hypothetical protein